MLNIEKYKDEIVSEIDKDPRIGYALVSVARSHGFYSSLNPYNGDDLKEYNKEVLNWLLSEYKEPILTNEEREYLSAVCKPFKIESMYKGMESERIYTPQELGITCRNNRSKND